MPWGMGDLARNLGFGALHHRTGLVGEFLPWRLESDAHAMQKHWGARSPGRDHHRGYGGFVLEHQGRKILPRRRQRSFPRDSNKSGQLFSPENRPAADLRVSAGKSLRNVHMGPDEAINKVFQDLRADWFAPMHYGNIPTFL